VLLLEKKRFSALPLFFLANTKFWQGKLPLLGRIDFFEGNFGVFIGKCDWLWRWTDVVFHGN
jgi:hypothetical protein